MKIFVLALAIIFMLSLAQAQQAPAKPAAPGRKVPADPIVHKNGDDVLEQLQGGSADIFVVIFYVEQAKGDELKGKITSEVGKDHPWVRITSVDLTKVQDYYKLFRVVKLEGEPKRGHTAPQVLVMSKGEGFVIRGPKIVEGILKRINRVEDGSIFGQSGNTPGTDSYSFSG